MTLYKLINKYREHYPHEHYFDRETLKFFGERMSEMRVLKGIVNVADVFGNEHETYEHIVSTSYQQRCS